jgi:hypothetical protein
LAIAERPGKRLFSSASSPRGAGFAATSAIEATSPDAQVDAGRGGRLGRTEKVTGFGA